VGDEAGGVVTAPGGRRHGGPVFWLALVPGWLIIAWAVRGVWRQRGGTVPRGFARWFLGAGLVHDLLWLPAVLVVGWGTRRSPAAVRWPVQAGLATSAVLTVFAWPLLRGYSRRASNPTVLPLRYGTAFATVLAIVWAAVALAIAIPALRRRRRRALVRP
jgi:hypothetical protein